MSGEEFVSREEFVRIVKAFDKELTSICVQVNEALVQVNECFDGVVRRAVVASIEASVDATVRATAEAVASGMVPEGLKLVKRDSQGEMVVPDGRCRGRCRAGEGRSDWLRPSRRGMTAMKVDDLSPEYRAMYESFRKLGLSEREALTAATCRSADGPGYLPGNQHRTGRLAERAAMFTDPGVAVEEAFGEVGASMLGHEFGTEAGARRSFTEALRTGSVERHPSSTDAPTATLAEQAGAVKPSGDVARAFEALGIRVPSKPKSDVSVPDWKRARYDEEKARHREIREVTER